MSWPLAIATLVGGYMANRASANAAQAQMDFQESMSNTSYQRQVQDLMKAGINPMLVTKLGGASTPAGAMPIITNIGGAAAQAYSSAQQAEAAMKQAETQEALSVDQIKLTRAQVEQVEANTEKIASEIKNLGMEYERIKETVFMLAAQADLYEQQGYTEMQRFKMVRETVEKLIQETKLIKLDVQAAEQLGNLGREYKELGPIIQNILQAIRTINR